MAKISNSYASVVRGVSQQTPELRLDGQHGEQVNMVSDPVDGLGRRRGTRNLLDTSFAMDALPDTRSDMRQFYRREFSVGTSDYTMLVRRGPKVSGSVAGLLHCYNKTGNTNVPVTINGADLDITTLLEAGVSAVTQVGRYVLIASNGHIATGVATDLYSVTANTRYGAAWVRGGAYSRTFTVTVSRASVPDVVVSYTTPASSYQGVLDTSAVDFSDPDYQKQVNDIVNAYNGEVTAWIGTAAAAVQPEAIAEELKDLLVAAGIYCARVGSNIVIDEATLTGLGVNDGGDGTLMRAVYQTIPDAAHANPVHQVGKIIQVQTEAGAPSYYLKAVPKSPGATGWAEVRWEEAAALSFVPGVWFAIGTVEAGVFYVASTPALLQTLVPALTLPAFTDRQVGDSDSNKAPFFIGRAIDYMGTFQDRLVVGSGGVLSFSEVGNYFNFFRTSVLTVVDNDAVELYALGSEEDTIRHSTIFDKSLLLFGDKQQYSINGRVPLTPATTAIIQSSAHEGTTDTAPLASGDFVFYTKLSEGYTQAYQLAIGDVADTSSSTEISKQVPTYMPGRPAELVALTTPDTLAVLTQNDYSTLYAYRYLDNESRQRVLDAWSKWTFDPLLGDLIAVSTHLGYLLLFFARQGTDASGQNRTWVSVDRASLRIQPDTLPHLDSMRPYDNVVGGSASRMWYDQEGLATAYDSTTSAFLQGAAELEDVPQMITEFPSVPTTALWTGTQFDSYVEPTNPFVRDRNDVAIVTGTLTITSFALSYKNTGAIFGTVTTTRGTDTVLDFNGRILGADNNLLDIQPVSTGSVPLFVGRNNRAFTARIAARDWLPLTITGIEWTGQYFNNVRRL